MIIPEFIEIKTQGEYIRMAEAEIFVFGQRVGFVGGSSSEQTVQEAAEVAVIEALSPLIAAIQRHPDVERISRYADDGYEPASEYAENERIPDHEWLA